MLSRFVAFTSLGRKALPNQYDLFAFALIFRRLHRVTHVSHGVTLPLAAPESTVVSLDYGLLPYYALRTTLRMFAAIAASLVFTFVYATLAAKSRRAALVLIPLLDVLQSVPILGFLSFTVTFFLGLFPGSILGAECAAVFAIFTSQAWNMAFSFYQSLRSVPRDLIEVARGFRLSGWQRFWQLETPFAMPGLIWNMMMSMSGGWFFVVASEAIAVGDTTIKLPGIGSYLALAIEEKRIDAVFAAIVAMLAVIIAYDQLLFRPLVAFGARFRVELSAGQTQEKSFVAQVFARTHWMRALMRGPARAVSRPSRCCAWNCRFAHPRPRHKTPGSAALIDILWVAFVGLATLWAGWLIIDYMRQELSWSDVWQSVLYTALHHGARDPAHGARDLGLGAGRSLDRSAARARGKSAAPGAIPGGLSGERRFSRRRRSYPQVFPEPRYLAKLSDRLRHPMVHSFQRDRWRLGVSERSQGGGVEFSHSRLELVEERHHSRDFSLLRDGSADRLGRIVERGDRRGICEMGQRHGVGAWDRRLYRRRPPRTAIIPKSCSASR